jgi:hemerythrin superfamily protein
MQIYEALVSDHKKIKPLLDQLVKSAKTMDSDKRSHLLNEIRDELIPHARAEEAIFYNSLRGIDEVKDLAWHGYGEHAEAEAMLRTLQVMDTVNADYEKLAVKFRDAIFHHISEEEGKIFNAAKQVLADEEATQMADAFQQLKSEVKDQNFMQNTLDMIANVMPQRFAERIRSLNHRV